MAALCLLFVVLTVAYLVMPAHDMPSMVPGAPPTPGWAHRYGQATGSFLLSLFLGFTAYLRWRRYTEHRMIRRAAPVTPDDVNHYTDVRAL